MNDQALSALKGLGQNPFETGGVGFSGYAHRLMMPSNGVEGPNFMDTLMNTVSGINETMQKPDALLKDMMTGGKTDVHDVMIANTQAELAVNMATQITTKVIQAYDRILQIQV
jgi:flagellar hook-basal body complex protein FliE